MKNIWATHTHEDSKHFNGFYGSEIEAKWALFNILAVHVLMIMDRLILSYFGPNHIWALVILLVFIFISIYICLEA